MINKILILFIISELCYSQYFLSPFNSYNPYNPLFRSGSSSSSIRNAGGGGGGDMSIEEMCELPPERGEGRRDIVRIYFNPVLQQCLPFSWSGMGGNANRFVSIKNCYELCHPANPGFKKLTASGLRPYFVARRPPLYCSSTTPTTTTIGSNISEDVFIRQIENPLDPDKTLTLVQPVQYILGKLASTTRPPKIVIEKRIRHPPYYYPRFQQNCFKK